MISRISLRYFSFILFFGGIGFSLPVFPEEQVSVDELLNLSSQYLNTAPVKSISTLAKLKVLQPTFNEKQRERYYFISAISLGFIGKHRERVELVESFIDKVNDPELRAKFFYQLSDGYTHLGEYEKALVAMNQSIVMLPKLIELGSKVTTLQAAITLFSSLLAYDEAMVHADRMYALESDVVNSLSKCYGLANRIEIYFLSGNHQKTRSLLPEAIQSCNASNRQVVSLLVKAIVAIDLIETENDERNVDNGLSLLYEYSKTNQTSEYVTLLEEVIARSYLKNGNLKQAERYGMRAYQHAKSEDIVRSLEKTSETMAAIKRAQGQLDSALEYYDINLALKKKVLNDQLQKNLAYQRVKFDTQDKANQLALLEQKNKNLTIEKALQQGKNQNLLLLMTLGLILLAILGAWLVKTLQQKNIFRTSSQVDGLTQVSNRSHFITCATQSFKNAENRVSIVLFDMDSFKNINDTFGHAVGDWVLKTVCDTVKTQLRKADALGRLGGEEFAICLPNFTEEEAQALAERCRAAIAAIDTNPSGFSFVITASFGVATRGMRGQYSFEETLAAADKALYFAKNEGRNRVSLYQ
ncbi:MAG: GGDEF domain-containing protein [Undibacterium sp.]|nr:GGDEF domain-containing protein [Undibacterium sp.]